MSSVSRWTAVVVAVALPLGARAARLPQAPRGDAPVANLTAASQEIPAALLQLSPDSRPWTEKVVGGLLSQALQAGENLDCIVTLRQPAVLQGFTDYGPGNSGRLRWIARTGDDLDRDYASSGVRILDRYSHVPALHVEVPREYLEALASDPRVEAVRPNWTVHALRADGEALMHVPAVQALGYTGTGVTIAVLDSGVDYTHPELAPGGSDMTAKTIIGRDVIDATNQGKDQEGHGTSVAGIAAGSTGGVAPAAHIYDVRVLDSSGNGTSSQILTGIDDVLTSVTTNGNPFNIRALNLSVGGYLTGVWDPNPGNCDSISSDFKSAFDSLLAAGVVVAVASGNGGCTTGVAWPACISSALAVGDVYADNIELLGWLPKYDKGQCIPDGCNDSGKTGPDVVACFSDSGDKLDVWAPGHCSDTPTWVSGKTNQYDQCFGGTSASAPYVSGEAALLAQAVPTATGAALHDAIKNNGNPVTDPRNSVTRNRVRADYALSALTGACTAPSVPTGLTTNKSSFCSGQAFTLSWNGVSTAATYTVQLATDPGFTNTLAITPSTFSTTNATVSPLSGSTAASVYAHVRANASCGLSSAYSGAVQLAYTGTCTGPTYTTTYFVSGIARTPGIAPSYWYSDLSILDPGAAPVQLRLSFFGTTTTTPVTLTLPAGQQKTWNDVLGSAFGMTGTDVGAILIESTGTVTALARTYSRLVDTTTGKVETYGATYPASGPATTLAYGQVGWLPSLRSDGNFRTNVEAVNTGSILAQVEFTFYTDTGAPLGSALVLTVAPNRRAAQTAALAAGVGSAFARVRVLTPGAAVMAFGSVVDGNSTDPTTVELSIP
ncbi:MAG: S8 family peptidase [Acidobacteriota bacterium]